MTSPTGSPQAARDHARAMAGTIVAAMPIVPAAAADAPGEVVWEETIVAGGYAARRIDRGTRLRLIDLEGDACVSMLVFNAENPSERLNVADTMKIQWNAYLKAGKLLLSDMGRVLLSILNDDAASHDAICGASHAATNARRYGDGRNSSAQPSARDRLILGAAKHGLGRKDVHPCVNWFKGVTIAADGGTHLTATPAAPARQLLLRAEMDLLIVLANCPHVLDDRAAYTVTAVRATAWRGAVTPADDPVRTATPEGLRAFLNTEDNYRR